MQATMSSLLLVLTALCAVFLAADGSDLSRGFGDHLDWKSLDSGLADAKEKERPVMLLIHKTWCSACKALGKEFQDVDGEVAKLSKHFTLINLQDDEEPKEEKFGPDGKYIPRILFLNSDGEPDVDIQNVEGNPNYVYFYSQAVEVAASMKEALRKMPPSSYKPHPEL